LFSNQTGTLSPTSLADITGIGFATYSSASGDFNNLSLTVTVPEPASILALCGLGAMGLLLFARRRRKS
jgi:hypothetical protein